MKKNIFVLSICTTLLLIASIANSAQGPYISGNLGFATVSDSDLTDSALPGVTLDIESDPGFALGVAAGYAYGNNIRFEAEVTYQKNDLDKGGLMGLDVGLTGDRSSLALLLNGYYDFANDSAFTPFISAGLGTARVEVNDFNVTGSGDPAISDDATVFAYQFGAGVAYAINENMYLDVKYRYLGTSDPEYGTETFEYSSHNFYAGLRVFF